MCLSYFCCLQLRESEENRPNVYPKISLMDAARKGVSGRVRELVAMGTNVNDQDQQGETALMAAAQNGHTDCVNELLLGSAALNILDNKGNTALIHAVKGGTIECAKTLITEGADVNKGTVPPLIYSIMSKCFDITNELLKAGAYVNDTDANENTALIEAVHCGKTTVVQSLCTKELTLMQRTEMVSMQYILQQYRVIKSLICNY